MNSTNNGHISDSQISGLGDCGSVVHELELAAQKSTLERGIYWLKGKLILIRMLALWGGGGLCLQKKPQFCSAVKVKGKGGIISVNH